MKLLQTGSRSSLDRGRSAKQHFCWSSPSSLGIRLSILRVMIPVRPFRVFGNGAGSMRKHGYNVGPSFSYSMRSTACPIGQRNSRAVGPPSPQTHSHPRRCYRLVGAACCQWIARKSGRAIRATDAKPLAGCFPCRSFSSFPCRGYCKSCPLWFVSWRCGVRKKSRAMARLCA